eukprot:scaffold32195_cov65-Phaeocystis_antarctica.AAC.6
MYAQARADMAKLEAERFPAPEVIECEQYGSKARYLTQKLHSDVPLDELLRGLYKAVVSSAAPPKPAAAGCVTADDGRQRGGVGRGRRWAASAQEPESWRFELDTQRGCVRVV